MTKTYIWLGPERLKLINDNQDTVSLLYDLGLLPEEISAHIRGYVAEERERCAKIAESFKALDPYIASTLAMEIRKED